MTPDDPAPDEEFALAVAQKAQVRLLDFDLLFDQAE